MPPVCSRRQASILIFFPLREARQPSGDLAYLGFGLAQMNGSLPEWRLAIEDDEHPVGALHADKSRCHAERW